MNSFWDFVDWLLPPVRIIDDLTDDYAHRSRSSQRRDQHHSHHHPSQSTRRLSGRDHDKDRERDRDRDRERRKEKERGREKEKEREQEERERKGRASEQERLRQRIQQLERENESLLEQLRATREELSKLTTAVFPPTPISPIDPSIWPLALAHSHSQSSPVSSTSADHQRIPQAQPLSAQNSAEAALADPKRLFVLYTSLRATYSDARQVILSQAEELASLKSFLSKNDEWSGAQLLQALADLNAEIVQLAASVAEEFALGLRSEESTPSAAKERDREIVTAALGVEMIRLLEEREHASDPTLVQFALQAWEVWCVSRVMDAFCYGLPAEVDEALKLVFERMQREEPQPTTSRWRALTYKHMRSFLARPRPRGASDPPSPEAVTPSPFNSASSSIASSSSLSPPLLSLTEANLRGVLAILALSGCTDARGLHRDPLRARFGSALSRISARAERISSVVKEGVLSGLFDVVWIQPCRNPKSSKRASSVPATETPLSGTNGVGSGATRGKGKEREWLKEVERAQRGDAEAQEVHEADKWFDWDTMENIYAGHCNERCRVLCTVELGLAFSRKQPEEREEESVDGDGMIVSTRPTSGAAVPNTSRPVSMGGGNMDVGEDGAGEGPSARRLPEGSGMLRNLLLKPKVLLESVVDIL